MVIGRDRRTKEPAKASDTDASTGVAHVSFKFLLFVSDWRFIVVLVLEHGSFFSLLL